MTFTQAFKTSATSTNSHIQDNTRQDDHILATYDTLLGSNHLPQTDLEVDREWTAAKHFSVKCCIIFREFSVKIELYLYINK